MARSLAYSKEFAFNAICPYFTMFPLEFPLRVLTKHKNLDPIVYDPFCGRGTTIYAARTLGLRSFGLDTSPIAAAIAQAKLASADCEDVISLAEEFLAHAPRTVPDNQFFRLAFSKRTLLQICSLREGLLNENHVTDVSAILRAAALGCLHGPLLKSRQVPSYFSNQMPRTFASKPHYSVEYWRKRSLLPPNVSVIDVLKKKLERIQDLHSESPSRIRNIKCLDARNTLSYGRLRSPIVTVTSPPYYGMRTYVQDQWLRMWFLGGDSEIEYENNNQLRHSCHQDFIADLAKVWTNLARRADTEAHLYIRFGSVPSVKSDAREIIKASLESGGHWKLISVRNAETSSAGKRQADHMGSESKPIAEFDFHAVLN